MSGAKLGEYAMCVSDFAGGRVDLRNIRSSGIRTSISRIGANLAFRSVFGNSDKDFSFMFLITGATGFVGTALRADLDRRQILYRAISRSELPGFVTVPTLDQATDWKIALDGIDTVIHLAARVHVMNEKASDPLAAFRSVNVGGTMALARQAAESGVKTFVFISSIKVNGEIPPKGKRFTADDVPTPSDPYGISKMEAETALLDLAKTTDMNVVIIRPPLVYGHGVKANFATVVRWVKKGIPLPLGDSKFPRSLVYVGNLTDLIITAAGNPAAANQIFLAGDDKDLTLVELLNAIAAACNKPIRLYPVPAPLMRFIFNLFGRQLISQRLFMPMELDIEKTKQFLKWTPPFTIEEGLKLTVADA